MPHPCAQARLAPGRHPKPNATAFSPTDVMPLVPWAKIAMVVQSMISLIVLGLVIARAVNVFS